MIIIVGDESWKEMVQEAVGDQKDLHIELVHQIAQYGETAEALRWAHFYNVDKSDWPYSVRMLDDNPEQIRWVLIFVITDICFKNC